MTAPRLTQPFKGKQPGAGKGEENVKLPWKTAPLLKGDSHERCSRCRHLIPTRVKLLHHFWCVRSFPGSLNRNV